MPHLDVVVRSVRFSYKVVFAVLEALAHLSKRAGRVYGGNVGLAFELRACAEKALRTGRERGKHSLRLDFLVTF
jgi:hypothetical protein